MLTRLTARVCLPCFYQDVRQLQKRQVSFPHSGLLPSSPLPPFPFNIFRSHVAFRAGRHDSAKRHCVKCPGFKELGRGLEIFPVKVTRGEYEAIKEFRKNSVLGQGILSPPVESALSRVSEMLAGAKPLAPATSTQETLEMNIDL
jgi:hypothetical protein